MQTDVRIRNFRVEIVKRINGIYPLLERGDSDYKSVLVQCLKIVDIEINKNPLSL